MLTLFAVSALLVRGAPMQPVNAACAMLTAPEVTALVGAGAKAIPVSASPGGASCMYQNDDKVATILVSNQATPERAASLFATKQRIVSGQDVAGWPTKAYAGAMGTAAAVGLTKGTSFVEVKLIDPKHTPREVAQQLRTAMKSVAARM
jgi:hypothetical protein